MILVGSVLGRAAGQGREVQPVAVVVTAASGFDLGYVWKGQAGRAGPERPAGGYYLNAALAGEPPGRWWGPGAVALGFAAGQVVERGPYELVYRQVDPRTGARLGRARGCYASFADHLARLRAREPHATAERLVELEREAAQATRRAPAYTDMTVSFSKSVSVLHASIRENERRARLAGDQAGAAWWADAEARFQGVLQAANRAGLEHAQRHAGFTRTGYHGTRVNGQEPGRFEEAGLVVTSWLQGTSRDGDPQDHVHNQIARMVKTGSDGRWRALDTVSLRGVLPAVQAVVATHAECGLTREFGVTWVPRPDGAGNEIAGISREQMDAYSSRTVAITGALPGAVASWTAKYGREPSRRELLYIRQEVTLASRDGKEPGPIDWDAVTARWDARLGGALAAVAPRVSNLRPGLAHASQRAAQAGREGAQPRTDAHAQARPPAGAIRDGEQGPHRAALSRDDRAAAIRRALASVQSARSAWTRADLLRHLALALPPESRLLAPDQAVALLGELADEALSGRVEQVACLEAPQWPPLPPSLRRDLDGRSVYTRPGTTRYATRVQLAMEERLVQDARRPGAPCLSREQAAALLRADPAALDALLRGHAAGAGAAQPGAAQPRVTQPGVAQPRVAQPRAGAGRASAGREGAGEAGSGLRADQAAALFHALTCDQVAVVLTGPAGSGKTRVLAEGARAWARAGLGPVVGIATAQAARNVLAAAGVGLAENSAVFLGHLPGERGARGAREIAPGTLLVIDEASMMSLPDLAGIVALAAARGAKVLVAGDQEQLAAVEAGGGMMLLAARLGYVQLAEAVRFTAEWERGASLRLRAGDASALDEYRAHGRIRGAAPEQALDEAARRYVAHHLAGRDVLLMIRDHERCREASRRIRDDLIHLGLVDGAGPRAGLAAGAEASAGDLIIARRNDHAVEAGEPGRALANGDLLRVEEIRAGVPWVRRALDCDPATGRRRWTSRVFPYAGHGTADLGYAVTGHSAQGRTVACGVAVITGTEDRQWMYVAMTRATESNVMIAFTQPGRPADPQAGTRPAPEIARHERARAERAGLAAPNGAAAGRGPGHPHPGTRLQGPGRTAPDHAGAEHAGGGGPEPRDMIAVAADILERDGSEASALETRNRALAGADHLAVLHATWQGETAALRAGRYRRLVAGCLPPGYGSQDLDSPRATWLWRTLRAAEAAGLDPAQAAREAIGSRSLAGARDVAAVIDARIRQRAGGLVPLPPRPWSEQVPETADPAMRQFLTDLAAAMDARKERIGEHLAARPPGWALAALGPVPGDPLDRLEWERKACDIGAYRELYGWDHPADPVGPEPAGDSPEKRAAWHAAFTALALGGDAEVRAQPDGALQNLRAAYAAETAWAPRHVGRELGAIRASADDASLAAIRARAEHQAAARRGDHDAAARHASLAGSWTAMGAFYRQQETELAATMDARAGWERATAPARRLAVAADAELRRRHPDRRIEPLRSAEPAVTPGEREQLLGAPAAGTYETPGWITRLAAERRAVRDRLAQRQPGNAAGPAAGLEPWPAWPSPARDAILQPPRPQIRPAALVAERAALAERIAHADPGRDAGYEAEPG